MQQNSELYFFLVVGQLLRCHVCRVKSAVSSTTVDLSLDPTLVDNTLYDPSCGMNPHLVVPGMKFEVTAVMVFYQILYPMSNAKINVTAALDERCPDEVVEIRRLRARGPLARSQQTV
jgi:hypothetical protein